MSNAPNYFEKYFNDEYFEQECDAEILSESAIFFSPNAIAVSTQGAIAQVDISIERFQLIGITLLAGLRLEFANNSKRDRRLYDERLIMLKNGVKADKKVYDLINKVFNLACDCNNLLANFNAQVIVIS